MRKLKNKTFIGKIDRGFDFLGLYFGKEGRRIAKKTVLKFAERIAVRLYKAGYSRNELKGGYPVPDCVSLYVKRWITWVKSMYDRPTTTLFDSNSRSPRYGFVCQHMWRKIWIMSPHVVVVIAVCVF